MGATETAAARKMRPARVATSDLSRPMRAPEQPAISVTPRQEVTVPLRISAVDWSIVFADALQVARARILRYLERQRVTSLVTLEPDAAEDVLSVSVELSERDPALAQLAAAASQSSPPGGCGLAAFAWVSPGELEGSGLAETRWILAKKDKKCVRDDGGEGWMVGFGVQLGCGKKESSRGEFLERGKRWLRIPMPTSLKWSCDMAPCTSTSTFQALSRNSSWALHGSAATYLLTSSRLIAIRKDRGRRHRVGFSVVVMARMAT